MVEFNNSPGLYIGDDYKSLVVVMNTFNNIKETIVIINIPIKKWINVIIRCNQNILDIFINGTLAKSHILNGIPKQNYDDVNIGLNGGFAGMISSFQYFAYAIGINKIQNIVDKAPNIKTYVGSNLTTKPRYLSYRWFFPDE